MQLLLRQAWIAGVTSIYCSNEQKAVDGALILAEHLSLGFTRVHALGENDRSSTGFLVPMEFESVADRFFGEPEASVRGWERAVDAQPRIVSAVELIAARDRHSGSIVIISHGAVGTLLYCKLTGRPISRRHDQPPTGGGNYFSFDLSSRMVHNSWLPIDQPLN